MAQISVLLVEDDELDVEAVQRAFVEAKIANPIVVAKDGIEALEILRGSDDHAALGQPYLVLLDINMPRMNGLELLQEMRQDQELRKSIVFVLTTSDDDRDICAAYGKQVAGYLLKSSVGPDFLKLTEMLDFYWRIVQFPPHSPHPPRV